MDSRLNQNRLVGEAAQYIQEGYVDYANGATLADAAVALIPRVIWPDKPVSAGSPGIVSAYTGVQYTEGTSVGIGQVMEFYINFGTLGVVGGFLVMGTLLGIMDGLAAHDLRRGDWQGFTLWFLVGLGFLQSGGSLVEIVSTSGSGLILALILNHYLPAIIGKPEVEGASGALGVPSR